MAYATTFLHQREREFRRGRRRAIWWCEQVAATEVVSMSIYTRAAIPGGGLRR
jgi:hypothetical protein